MMKKRKTIKRAVNKRGLNRLERFEMRGISKMVIILGVAVLLVGAGTLYFMSQKGMNPAASLIGKTLNPNCEYKDPDLCKFFNNWKEMSNYSMNTLTKSAGNTSESVFESSGKDKTHILSSENGKESFNMITIGDTTYTKDYTDNKWFKQVIAKEPSGTPAPVQNDIKTTFDDKKQMEDKTEFKALGKEACGNLTCFKYQIITTTDDGAINYMWFDDREYLLRKEAMTGKNGDVNESTFSYDNANISAPSPVKEGEPGAGSIPGMSETDKKAIEQAQKDAQNAQQNVPQDYVPPADTGNDIPPTE